MSQPSRFLVRMGIFLAIVGVAAGLLFFQLRDAFMANPVLNGVILGVLALGILHAFRTVTMLRAEVAWIDSFRRDTMAVTSQAAPRLLAPMAAMLGERKKGPISLSTMAMRTMLDGIAARLDESREVSRYMIGLLVFLGLLGTFWGLLETVQAVGGVVGGLQIGGGDLNTVFEDLKSGLQSPLSGMGTAFSSSLFGLAGSLVLGFLELQGGQAQNRFYNELEEWLSGLTRIGGGGVVGEAEQSVPAYIQALLEQTADGLEGLQRALSRSEDSRTDYNRRILDLAEKVGTLTDQMQTEQTLMRRLAESQAELRPVLTRLAEAAETGADETTRVHLRNIESYAARMHEELSAGRQETVHEIRSEIRLLARTIAALAEETER